MKKPVIYVGGNKGGVGKSLVAMSVLDDLIVRGETPTLYETDTGNPDVARAYDATVNTVSMNLDEANGWIDAANALSEAPGPVVVNSAARSQKGLAQNWEILQVASHELGREIIVLWVINRQRESVGALRDFMELLPKSRPIVLKNLFFGPSEKFALFDDSKTRKLVDERGGRSLTFPDLADRVADDLINQRLTIANAAAEMQVGNRAELTRWRNAVGITLRQIYE